MHRPTLGNAARPLMRGTDSRIGILLQQAGRITPDHAERALRLHEELGIRFGEAARRLGLVTEADIEQALARQFDFPYLRGTTRYSPYLLAAHDPFCAAVEAVRAVRSQLTARWFARGNKSLLILGVAGGDGASLFCANLAVVFAQLGERTLLVDANLRRPGQHAIFDLQNRQGLSDLLAGRASPDVITPIEGLDGLHVLGAGTVPPNPHELLHRPSFGEWHGHFEARFDVVLYDVAAWSLAADALAVGAGAGGVLLLARRDRTALSALEAAGARLAAAGAELVGSVMLEF